ncbi:MAG: hypothetical protein A2X64_05240 [Ignavibacteria bacterium GWF2_33_9]|nr:MAG: hypothetical protein A2X64_05240 [Ignavibacteria bacterium GWF2_33_9]
MKQNYKLIPYIIAIPTIILICILINNNFKRNFEINNLSKLSRAEVTALFHEYDQARTKDPATGLVPENIRKQVLNFVSKIPVRNEYYFNNSSAKFGDYPEGDLKWENLGPDNIGGRTNCIQYDIENEDILLVGAASGGVWRSVDKGYSWTKTTSSNAIQNVYCIAQDIREGKTKTWYYGTGELLSTVDRRHILSARMSYPGDGIFKSIDNGATWEPIPSTQGSFAGNLKDNFQGVWKILPDNTILDEDVIYAACLGGILKSTDGGKTWVEILGDSNNKPFSTDIVMTDGGILFASMSRVSLNGVEPAYFGIFRSVDRGLSWDNITPADFPSNAKVIKLALTPNSNNMLYALVDYPNANGMNPYTFQASSLGLWKLANPDIKSKWKNVSVGLISPSEEVMTPATLGGYAFNIKVSPFDENTVFVMGTSLYKSSNGFDDNSQLEMIGGYYYDDGSIGYDLGSDYLHPDVHDIVFLESASKSVFSVSDGGVYFAQDITRPIPQWEQRNDGFITSQFYSIAVSKSDYKDFLIGGLQDNGTFCLRNKKISKTWEEVYGGDGMPVALSKDLDFGFVSWYSGNMVYFTLNPDTHEPENGYYASPNISNSNFNFYTVFQLNIFDNNSLFVAAKNKIYYQPDLKIIETDQNTYYNAWETNSQYTVSPDENFTCFAQTENYPDALFAGTNKGKLYLYDNISNNNKVVKYDISSINFPSNAWLSDIAFDEVNGIILVTFSNYNVVSIFASSDDGSTWESVAGNLEENTNGLGAGPSVRTIKVMKKAPIPTGKHPSGNDVLYFVGTDVGLFSTDNLNGINTIWYREGADDIGNVIVEDLDVVDDGTEFKIYVATQGSGVFGGEELIISVNDEIKLEEKLYQNYPNPADKSTKIMFTLQEAEMADLSLYNITGNKIRSICSGYMEAGDHTVRVNTSGLIPGAYFYTLKTKNSSITKKLIVK